MGLISFAIRPKIHEVQAVQEQIDNADFDDELEKKSSPLHCEWGSLIRELWKDRDGTPRRYSMKVFGEETSGEVIYYYDAAGHHRFTFEEFRSTTGTHRVRRVFFDQSGSRIYRDREMLAGKDYPEGYELVEQHPERAFALGCADA